MMIFKDFSYVFTFFSFFGSRWWDLQLRKGIFLATRRSHFASKAPLLPFFYVDPNLTLKPLFPSEKSSLFFHFFRGIIVLKLL